MRIGKTALIALLLLPLSAMAEQFDLACTWAVGANPPSDLTLHVDTDHNTVNGYAAKITDTEIRYAASNEKGHGIFVVNRYTGGMTITFTWSSQRPDSFGRRTCVKLTERQF